MYYFICQVFPDLHLLVLHSPLLPQNHLQYPDHQIRWQRDFQNHAFFLQERE